MEELKNILNDLDKNRGKEFHSLDSCKILYDRFEKLFQTWLKGCKSGEIESIANILSIIDEEITRRKMLGEYGSPKKMNSLEIIYGFKKKLRQCKFEIAKKNEGVKKNECDCLLQLKHKIAPKYEDLKKYGIACFVHGEEYLIYECKVCQKRWIQENIGGGGVFISNWISWQPNEYPLKRLIN